MVTLSEHIERVKGLLEPKSWSLGNIARPPSQKKQTKVKNEKY